MTSMRNDGDFGLPPGNWRYDPKRRIQVWVPLDPDVSIHDSFEDGKPAPYVPPMPDRHRKKPCLDCDQMIQPRSTRCRPCHAKHAKTLHQGLPTKPVVFSRRLHEPIDETRVQKVLDGTFTRCSRPERLEVLARWSQLGRSDQSLIDLTGWNVPRDRKYLTSLNEKDAA